MTDTTQPPVSPNNVDLAELAALVGDVAANEFAGAKDIYKASLLQWARALPTIDDQAFQREAESAISDSALVASFRGNWEHEHFKASACHHESERRKSEAHSPDCTASTLYESAFQQVVRTQGHHTLARDLRPCTCPEQQHAPASKG